MYSMLNKIIFKFTVFPLLLWHRLSAPVSSSLHSFFLSLNCPSCQLLTSSDKSLKCFLPHKNCREGLGKRTYAAASPLGPWPATRPLWSKPGHNRRQGKQATQTEGGRQRYSGEETLNCSPWTLSWTSRLRVLNLKKKKKKRVHHWNLNSF